MSLFKSGCVLFFLLCGDGMPASSQISFKRGDANADGQTDMSDAVFALLHLFRGGTEPPCLKSADVDDSGGLDVTDAVYLLLYLFAGGAAPPSPFFACGSDATDDPLSCQSHAPCEWESLSASFGILRTIAGKGEVRQ